MNPKPIIQLTKWTLFLDFGVFGPFSHCVPGCHKQPFFYSISCSWMITPVNEDWTPGDFYIAPYLLYFGGATFSGTHSINLVTMVKWPYNNASTSSKHG